MAQYVLQVKNDTQQLIKCYEVDGEHPVRNIDDVHNLNRKQIVITDINKYNEVVTVYNQNLLNAKFTLNEGTNEITWIID